MDQFLSPVEIAKSVCVLMGDVNYSKIARVLTAVGRAADDVYGYAVPNIKSDFVRIQENLTAPLPCGAANVIKVGILNNHGQIIHLYEENRLRQGKYNELIKKAENGCSDVEDIQNSIITQNPAQQYWPADYFHGCAHGVGNYGELYGFRFDPGTIGTWRSVAHEGYIEFGSGAFVQPGRYVLVEYKDAGPGRLSTIPNEAFAAIHARTRYYLGMGREASIDFKREYTQFKRLLLRKDIHDYLRAFGDDKASPSAIVTSSSLSFPSSTTSTSTTTILGTRNLNYYLGDDDAIANGLKPGQEYLLANHNDYDLPGGLPKFVYNGPV